MKHFHAITGIDGDEYPPQSNEVYVTRAAADDALRREIAYADRCFPAALGWRRSGSIAAGLLVWDRGDPFVLPRYAERMPCINPACFGRDDPWT